MQEHGDEERKDNSKTDEVVAAKMDNSETGAMPCQKSGIDHFNNDADPKSSCAMSKHVLCFISFAIYLTLECLMP